VRATLAQETIKDFERNLSDMVSTFVENVQALTGQCRDLENQHHERLLDIGLRLLDKGMKSELDSDLAQELQEVYSSLDQCRSLQRRDSTLPALMIMCVMQLYVSYRHTY